MDLKKIYLFVFFCTCFVYSYSQNDFLVDDYSDPSLWTKVGSYAEVSNGQMRFINGCPGGQQRRVYRSLPSPISSDDDWKVRLKVHCSALGNNKATSHILFALTETSKPVYKNCDDVACSGFPASIHHSFSIAYITASSGGGNPYFRLHLRHGDFEVSQVSNFFYYNLIGKDLYIEIEKANDLVTARFYTDINYNNEISSSSIVLDWIPTRNLNFVQHGVSTGGWSSRKFTGHIDNLSIAKNHIHSCDDGIQNGEETGVDCGGPDCDPCPTCDDGIQNGGELGVDCGGDCPNACFQPEDCNNLWEKGENSIFYNLKNVGIGTDNSLAKLSVIGNMGVNETMKAHDFRATPDVWPDYVFSPDYDLKSLKEIKAYIEQYGKLPKIPSEQEVIDNGINLKEQNILLVEKIEELTLLMIELNKRIKQLEKENPITKI